MRAGYDDYLNPDGKILRSLLKFPLSAIPPGETVTSAILEVYLVASYDYPYESRTITTYRVAEPWGEDIVIWNNVPSFGEAYGSTLVSHNDASVGVWYSFDVTALVSAWHNGTYLNYGLMLRGPEWSGNDSSRKGFATGETIYPPTLVVNFEPSPPTSTPTSTLTPTSTPTPTETATPTNTPTATPTSQHIYLPLLLKDYVTLIPTRTSTSTPTLSLPSPQQAVALVVSIADYEHMAPASASSVTRAGAPGFDIMYTVCDGHQIQGRLAYACSCNAWPGVFASALRADRCSVRLLEDSQATKAGIRDAILDWLDPREDENTQVIFFFSGHGMYAADDDPPEEADGYDEFIVPYDVDCLYCDTPPQLEWIPETAIRDDELDSWLSQLESQHIVVLIDSCFAGGMASSPVATARGLPQISALSSATASLQIGDGFARDINRSGRVVLMASQETQGSWEFGELKNGAFTYFLAEALRSPAADTNGNGWVSAEEAYLYLRDRVDNYVYGHTGYHQDPKIYDGVSGQVDLTQPIITTACPW